MGFGDKLKFWKKEEDDFSDLGDFGLGDIPGPSASPAGPAPEKTELFPDMNTPSQGISPGPMTPPPVQHPSTMPDMGAAEQKPESMGMAQQTFTSAPQTMQPTYNKDLELISAKLDSMKAMLENINQRLANPERIAKGDQETPRYNW